MPMSAFLPLYGGAVLIGQTAAFMWQGAPNNGSELISLLDLGSRLTLSGVLLAGVVALWRAYRAQSEERIKHSDFISGIVKETTAALVENTAVIREMREEMKNCGFRPRA